MTNLSINLWPSMLLMIIIMSIVLWWLIGKFIYDYILEKKQKDLQSIIEKTNKQSDEIIKQARDKSEQIIEKAEKQASNIMKNIEKKEKEMINQEREMLQKEKEIDKLINEEKEKIFAIAQLTPDQAKEKVFSDIKKEYESDLVSLISKIKTQYQESAKKEASNIIARTIYRVATNWISKFVSDTVHLPSEDFKWRIIWREWRNIQFFRKTTWVDITMDDTPEIVKISSFDPEKRFIAKITLEKLIKDWRINPVYIEKYYKETSEELPDILMEIWKETLLELGIPMMQPKILEYIWKFELRYSYWQNLLEHSKEVAKISELLASELWFDWLLAKKAWLLHDIWKIDVNSWESHAIVWANILRQYWFSEEIVNSAESHHFEVPQSSVISRIVAAADAISAWREWARNNNSEQYIERINSLENLIKDIEWTKKVYIMQAWREIRVFVDEEKISDLESYELNKKIKWKIEENLDYPWTIKIVTIRENNVISYIA